MTISELSKELQKERGKPLMLLVLHEVNRAGILTACKLLYQKQYEELDVVLQTPGGDIEPAFQYAKLFRRVAQKVNILVPYYSKSAGTLICLSADKIVMTDLSELGPLDTQIREEQDGNSAGYTSALNGFKALEQVQRHTIETLDIATKLIASRSGLKMSEAVHLANEFTGTTSGTLYSQLNPKKIGEYARALEVGERYGVMILTRYMNWDEESAKAVVEALVKDYPSHGFIIDREELESLNLPAEKAAGETEKILTRMRDVLSRNQTSIVELHEEVASMEETDVLADATPPAGDGIAFDSTEEVAQAAISDTATLS